MGPCEGVVEGLELDRLLYVFVEVHFVLDPLELSLHRDDVGDIGVKLDDDACLALGVDVVGLVEVVLAGAAREVVACCDVALVADVDGGAVDAPLELAGEALPALAALVVPQLADAVGLVRGEHHVLAAAHACDGGVHVFGDIGVEAVPGDAVVLEAIGGLHETLLARAVAGRTPEAVRLAAEALHAQRLRVVVAGQAPGRTGKALSQQLVEPEAAAADGLVVAQLLQVVHALAPLADQLPVQDAQARSAARLVAARAAYIAAVGQNWGRLPVDIVARAVLIGEVQAGRRLGAHRADYSHFVGEVFALEAVIGTGQAPDFPLHEHLVGREGTNAVSIDIDVLVVVADALEVDEVHSLFAGGAPVLCAGGALRAPLANAVDEKIPWGAGDADSVLEPGQLFAGTVAPSACFIDVVPPEGVDFAVPAPGFIAAAPLGAFVAPARNCVQVVQRGSHFREAGAVPVHHLVGARARTVCGEGTEDEADAVPVLEGGPQLAVAARDVLGADANLSVGELLAPNTAPLCTVAASRTLDAVAVPIWVGVRDLADAFSVTVLSQAQAVVVEAPHPLLAHIASVQSIFEAEYASASISLAGETPSLVAGAVLGARVAKVLFWVVDKQSREKLVEASAVALRVQVVGLHADAVGQAILDVRLQAGTVPTIGFSMRRNIAP